MKVGQLIKVLEQLNPDLDIYHVTVNGVVSPILSVRECNYYGFQPETFVGIACGKRVDPTTFSANPVYISQQKNLNDKKGLV